MVRDHIEERKGKVPQQYQDKLLVNRYKILKKINKGAEGTIYKAYDTEKERLVAIKRRKNTRMLKREFRCLSGVSHQHLVNFHDLYIKGGIGFFTMEWIAGKGIFETMGVQHGSRRACIDYDFLRKIIIQLTAAIRFLHYLGILHRDIKPDNILVEPCGKTVLLDFGFARRFCDYLPEWKKTKDMNGTFAYMSPEVLQGHNPEPASDWYSLGVVIYECLTGKLPGVICGVSPVPPVALISGTPADLNEIALTLLHRDAMFRASGPEIIEVLKKGGFFFTISRKSNYPMEGEAGNSEAGIRRFVFYITTCRKAFVKGTVRS